MTITLRIALILVSLGTFAMIMRKIRQSRMQIESAIFWIVLALVLVVYSVFPKVADACASLLGIYATTNFLFLFAIFVLILKVFFMSIHISQLESKIKELVQAMALEEKKYEEISQELGISINTVKYHIKNALSFLQTELSKYLIALILFFSC